MCIFRAETLKQAFSMLLSIVTKPNIAAILPGHGNGLNLDLGDYGILIVGTLLVFAVGVIQEKGINIRERIAKLPFIVKLVGFVLAVLVVIIFGAYGDGYGQGDMIYANF